jgi:pimeloyl-ACP methyl ester carboxylesterase
MAEMPYTEKRYASSDGLSLYYRDYPAQNGSRTPVVCLPGLTRNSKDFEEVALRLQAGRRVLSPDLRGRGKSDYDSDFSHYVPGIYVGDVFSLLAAEGLSRVIVIGTSLGGILAMLIAAARPDCLAGVVLNDVGPEIASEGAARIAGYVGKMSEIDTWADAAGTQKTLNQAAFPDWPDSDWMDFARRTFKENASGRPVPDYDPAIGRAFREPPKGEDDAPQAPTPDLWPVYGALKSIPTLAIRGALSDILATKTFERMKAEKPDLVTATIPRVGHAPTLSEPESKAVLAAFLAGL